MRQAQELHEKKVEDKLQEFEKNMDKVDKDVKQITGQQEPHDVTFNERLKKLELFAGDCKKYVLSMEQTQKSQFGQRFDALESWTKMPQLYVQSMLTSNYAQQQLTFNNQEQQPNIQSQVQ